MFSFTADCKIRLPRCAGETKRKAKEMSGSGGVGDKGLPQKRFYRARAHSNPFSDSQFPVYVMHLPAQYFTTDIESLLFYASPRANLFLLRIPSPSLPAGIMMY